MLVQGSPRVQGYVEGIPSKNFVEEWAVRDDTSGFMQERCGRIAC